MTPPSSSRPTAVAEGFGHAKAILTGEHAVVYGVPALAAPLMRGARARVVEPSERWTLHVEPWGAEVEIEPDRLLANPSEGLPGRNPQKKPEQDKDDALPAAQSKLALALSHLLCSGRFSQPARIEAEVEVWAGAGLGSSACLGVAVARALNVYAGRSASAESIEQQALAWEGAFHGSPSGIDTAVATRGRLIRFERSSPPVSLHPRRTLHLVIAYAGEAPSTAAMVEGVARLRSRSPQRFERTLEAFGSLVRNAQRAIEEGDLQSLGELFDMNQMLLAGWNVSTTRIEELCEHARRLGALGAKLTGAGGGGCMLALTPEQDVQRAVTQGLNDRGAEVISLEIPS